MPLTKLQAARIRAAAVPARELEVAAKAADPSFTSIKDNVPTTASFSGAPTTSVSNKATGDHRGKDGVSTQTLMILGAIIVVGWLVVRNS